jgi:uncharacterized protein YegL
MTDPLQKPETDHDLLVRLDERYSAMHRDIKELKDGTQKEVEALRRDVDNLKLWRSAIVGAFAVFDFILIPAAFAFFT